MTIERKKILILFCGSSENKTKNGLSDWITNMPELEIIADIDSEYIKSEQKDFLSPLFWQQVAQAINQKQKNYNGFVIIHPVETLLYTACAQSFLLHYLKKPIIFTSAHQKNLQDENQLSVKANLINSVQVATYNFGEVAVMFGNKLIRANQAQRVFDHSLNTFKASDSAVLGKIDFSIRIFEKNIIKKQVFSKFKFELNNNVDYLKIQPVFNIEELSRRCLTKAGIFVEGQGHQLPNALKNLFSKLSNIAIVLFDVSHQPDQKNIISINNMTLEASLVKFMYVLAQTKKLDKIKKLMQTDIAGEIISSKH